MQNTTQQSYLIFVCSFLFLIQILIEMYFEPIDGSPSRYEVRLIVSPNLIFHENNFELLTSFHCYLGSPSNVELKFRCRSSLVHCDVDKPINCIKLVASGTQVVRNRKREFSLGAPVKDN